MRIKFYIKFKVPHKVPHEALREALREALHRQNMVPFQWPQWLVVDAIGAQLRAFGNSTD